MGYLVVFLGGGVGAALRHGVNLVAARLLGTHFPFGTLTVNVVGSLVMGLMVAWFAFEGSPSQHWRLFLTTGMLGGFTTFSTFGLESFRLFQEGSGTVAALNIAASVGAGLAAVVLGSALARNLT